MTDLEIYKAIAQFMSRVELKGVEVEVFVTCINHINKNITLVENSTETID